MRLSPLTTAAVEFAALHESAFGFGKSARPALRPVCEKHRCTVAGRFADNARLKAPAQEARNWSWVVAFGRLSQSRGGTPIDGRLAIQARPRHIGATPRAAASLFRDGAALIL